LRALRCDRQRQRRSERMTDDEDGSLRRKRRIGGVCDRQLPLGPAVARKVAEACSMARQQQIARREALRRELLAKLIHVLWRAIDAVDQDADTTRRNACWLVDFLTLLALPALPAKRRGLHACCRILMPFYAIHHIRVHVLDLYL